MKITALGTGLHRSSQRESFKIFIKWRISVGNLRMHQGVHFPQNVLQNYRVHKNVSFPQISLYLYKAVANMFALPHFKIEFHISQ